MVVGVYITFNNFIKSMRIADIRDDVDLYLRDEGFPRSFEERGYSGVGADGAAEGVACVEDFGADGGGEVAVEAGYEDDFGGRLGWHFNGGGKVLMGEVVYGF